MYVTGYATREETSTTCNGRNASGLSLGTRADVTGGVSDASSGVRQKKLGEKCLQTDAPSQVQTIEDALSETLSLLRSGSGRFENSDHQRTVPPLSDHALGTIDAAIDLVSGASQAMAACDAQKHGLYQADGSPNTDTDGNTLRSMSSDTQSTDAFKADNMSTYEDTYSHNTLSLISVISDFPRSDGDQIEHFNSPMEIRNLSDDIRPINWDTSRTNCPNLASGDIPSNARSSFFGVNASDELSPGGSQSEAEVSGCRSRASLTCTNSDVRRNYGFVLDQMNIPSEIPCKSSTQAEVGHLSDAGNGEFNPLAEPRYPDYRTSDPTCARGADPYADCKRDFSSSSVDATPRYRRGRPKLTPFFRRRRNFRSGDDVDDGSVNVSANNSCDLTQSSSDSTMCVDDFSYCFVPSRPGGVASAFDLTLKTMIAQLGKPVELDCGKAGNGYLIRTPLNCRVVGQATVGGRRKGRNATARSQCGRKLDISSECQGCCEAGGGETSHERSDHPPLP